nr:MAG TPA: hypothetical protein [Caudoviricetes sp.]
MLMYAIVPTLRRLVRTYRIRRTFSSLTLSEPHATHRCL